MTSHKCIMSQGWGDYIARVDDLTQVAVNDVIDIGFESGTG